MELNDAAKAKKIIDRVIRPLFPSGNSNIIAKDATIEDISKVVLKKLKIIATHKASK